MSEKVKILFLSANPLDTSRLRVDKEQREIDHELKMSRSRERFELIDAEALRPNDLQQVLLDNEPQIVHFSGHGSDEGVVLEDEDGNAKPISTAALASLFRLFKDKVECVVLNACYSETQAKAIGEYVPYVIGMSNAIPDEAALQFSTGFYKAIGAGKSIEFAFDLGINALQLEGLDAAIIPHLIKNKTEKQSSLGVNTSDAKTQNPKPEQDKKSETTAKPAIVPPANTSTEAASPNFKLMGGIGLGLVILAGILFKMCSKPVVAPPNDPQTTATTTVVTPPIPAEKGNAIRTEIKEPLILEKGVYSLTGPTTVTYGGKLILKPGAIVKCTQDSYIMVERGGMIEAIGTKAAPIIFCGESDTDGFWTGIYIRSNTKENRMDFVQIKNAGNNTTATLQVGSYDGSVGRLSFSNSIISHAVSSGIMVNEYSTVDNFENNTITACKKFPVILFEGNMDMVKAAANNKLTGNTQDMIAIQGLYDAYTKEPKTLEKLPVPYCINSTERSKAIYIGSNLTIKPGVRIIMTSEAAIRIEGEKGSITANGTAAEPIVFEGEEHAKGFWDAIYILSVSDKNNLQFCNFSDGGRTQHCCGGGNDKLSGMITISDYYMNARASATIQNCAFANSSEAGIYYKKATCAVNADIVTGNTFKDNSGGNVLVK